MLPAIKKEIEDLLRAVGVESEIVLLPVPETSDGDLAFACFEYAKRNEISPAEAASQLAKTIHILSDGLIEKAAAAGAYLNFFINAEKLAGVVLSQLSENNFAVEFSDLGQSKKVVIEYPSQNTHKEFHIGHLRNVCIGNSLVKLLDRVGYEVVPVNYVNDFGRHVVKCLWGLNENYKHQPEAEDKQRFLGEIYAETNEYIASHEQELDPVLDDLQTQLENKQGWIWELFKKSRQWSLQGFAKIFNELGVKHDYVFFESDLKDVGQKKVDELLGEGIAKVGEGGAVIVDLEPYNLGVALLRKSSGAGLYLTSDLALADEKFKKISPDVSINITGTEQNLYFKQLFKVLELAGFGKELIHIGYGLVNTPEGKISSRLGNVVLYEDLRNKVRARILQEIQSRHADWTEDKLMETGEVLTLAVLKFSMLSHEAKKDFTFSFDKAVSFSGYSAPYVLYVIARINSLMEKSGQRDGLPSDLSSLDSDESKELLLSLAGYGQVVSEAALTHNPAKITHYCFTVAQKFNDFYDKHTILTKDSASTAARLALCGAVKRVLDDALGLIGVKSLSEM